MRGSSPKIDKVHLDEQTLALWQSTLGPGKRYLEYGAGGSTVAAFKVGADVTSVESDKRWVSAVEGACQGLAHDEFAGDPNLSITYANLGFSGTWGYPLFAQLTAARVRRWAYYSLAPWLGCKEFSPEIILVDGRFRVACVIASLLFCRNADAVVIVDDYRNRPQYGILAEIAYVEEVVGRSLVLRCESRVSRRLLETLYRSASVDPQ